MDKFRAPLYEALVKRHYQRETSFHVPGHKFGRGLEPGGQAFFRSVMGIDYTEIEGLDDLHHPEGIIREAQQLAAECFGAEECFFLVGGSTVGNLSMILSVCGPGDLLLVQRNAHKSVLNGLMLAGAKAVFLPPEWDGARTGLAAGVGRGTLERALKLYPEAKGVLLTNPNYYGMGSDLSGLAELTHSYGLPLLVDEAHGAHFGFHPRLPRPALACGADLVVQSTHKMLTAMTMGAMLHVKGSRVNRDRLKARLAMLQSSSPSYPLMASLDLSRRLMHTQGEKLLEDTMDLLETSRQRWKDELPEFGLLSFEAKSPYSYIDPLKWTLWDQTDTLSGFQLQAALGERKVRTEMADSRYAVLACSPATTREDLAALFRALKEIGEENGLREKKIISDKPVQQPYPMTLSEPVQLGLHHSDEHVPTELVTWDQSVGCKAAEAVIPYPPGIPVLLPGETISRETARYLKGLAEAGARFQGKDHSTTGNVKVYAAQGINL